MVEIISALTASGHKSICVYDIRLNLLGRIESWVSLVWPERYNVYSDTQGAQQMCIRDRQRLFCRPAEPFCGAGHAGRRRSAGNRLLRPCH